VANNVIVVGVDGSEGGRRALRWALGEAHRTEGAVKAVTAWDWDAIAHTSPVQTSPARQRERAEAISAREVAAVVAEVGSAVPIIREVVEGPEDRVLTAAARGARMLVLGSHGWGHLHHTVSDSVGAACIRRSTCPVVVVPDPRPALTPPVAETVAAG
jgi:nucleotide-binding universal stress UspA family protein